MKIVRFEHNGTVQYGALQGDSVHSLNGNIFDSCSVGDALCKLDEVKLLAPVEPKNVVGLGANYPETIARLRALQIPIGDAPPVFFKAPSAVTGPESDIICPKNYGNVSYSGELAIVMKRKAKQVSESDALDYVLGYTIANDVLAHELIMMEIVSARSKSFHTFCPVGPFIETDLDGDNVRVESRLNGTVRQVFHTSDMVYSVGKIIEFVSEFMTLEPGDVILTGSSGDEPEHEMEIFPGDNVEIEIEGLGLLKNSVV